MADVGLTHQLKKKRSKTLQEIATLKSDTSDHSFLIDSLTESVIALDEQIMVSYDETVARLSSNARREEKSAQQAVVLGLICAAIALFFTILIVLTRNRLVNSENQGLGTIFKSLVSEFVHTTSAEKASNTKIIRVNIVVVVGLLFMGLSILAFLIRTL